MTQPADILTITLNPALDMSTAVDKVQREDKLRCDTPVMDPGGGGINVARAICRTGGTATAFVALAGHRGRHLADLLDAENVPNIPVMIDGETRLSLAVGDRQADTQFRFVMPGPNWTARELQTIIDRLHGLMRPGLQVVLSGSQPPGVPADFPKTLADITRQAGAILTLDTSGAALSAQVTDGSAIADILRLDGAESVALAGRNLPTRKDVAAFAREVVTNGHAQAAVLAMGPDGSVLATETELLHATTPPVPVESKVGAGDSFVGAFTLARARGADWGDALRQGVAAASAAVMSPATELCRPEELRRLLPQVILTKL